MATFKADKLPTPPKTDDSREMYRWLYRVFEVVNGLVSLSASGIETTAGTTLTGTNLEDVVAQIDDLIPSAGEKAALPGTAGTPSASNKYVTNDDPRNTDDRAPTSHASNHAAAGSDPVSPGDIGATDTSHDHVGGDGAQIDHAGLANLTTGDPHTQYQKESEKNTASGYAGLNASSRITKGADATDDLIVDASAKGLVLRDSAAPDHYWRVTVNAAGALVVTDLGTSKP